MMLLLILGALALGAPVSVSGVCSAPGVLFTTVAGANGAVTKGTDQDFTCAAATNNGSDSCVTALPIETQTGLFSTQSSFVVDQCGMAAPHVHPVSQEILAVIKGSALLCTLSNQLPPQVTCADLGPGDWSFIPRATMHFFINTGNETLVTVGWAGSAYSLGAREGAVLGTIVTQAGGEISAGSSGPAEPLIAPTLGTFGAPVGADPNAVQGSVVFEKFSPSACEKLLAEAAEVPRVNGSSSSLRAPTVTPGDELLSGIVDLGILQCPAKCGGGATVLRYNPLDPAFANPGDITGTVNTTPPYNGGFRPDTPTESLSIGSSKVLDWGAFYGARATVARYTYSYCGVMTPHIHAHSNEFGVVLSGSGYFMIKDPVLGNITAHYLTPGETFHAQRGLMHWFVNPSPDTQWVTYQMWDTQAVTLQTFTHFIKAFSSIVPTANELVIGSNYTEPPDVPVQLFDIFSMLPTHSPDGCGGNEPCATCGTAEELAFLDAMVEASASAAKASDSDC